MRRVAELRPLAILDFSCSVAFRSDQSAFVTCTGTSGTARESQRDRPFVVAPVRLPYQKFPAGNRRQIVRARFEYAYRSTTPIFAP